MKTFEPGPDSPLLAMARKMEGVKTVPQWLTRAVFCTRCGCEVPFLAPEPHVCPDVVVEFFDTP